jgi:hypothetical protein
MPERRFYSIDILIPQIVIRNKQFFSAEFYSFDSVLYYFHYDISLFIKQTEAIRLASGSDRHKPATALNYL